MARDRSGQEEEPLADRGITAPDPAAAIAREPGPPAPMTPTRLIYLYGIVPSDAPAPPDDLAGIDGGAVTLHPVGDVAAIIGSVDAEVYSDDPLNARLDDLSWVGDRGLAHERVVDWFATRGPVIPLSLFSLHRDVSRMESRVEADAPGYARLLGRLRGRREWGLRLWRREAEARHGVDRLSPSLRNLAQEIEGAPPGRRFLLERRREAMRTEEVRAVSSRLAHDLFAALDAAASIAHVGPVSAGPGPDRVLLLDAAFLVADDALEEFHAALASQAGALAGTGFEIEFTGPWPPYHFIDIDDD